MALTKAQKIYGAILAAAVGAFVSDRSASGPVPASAASLVVPHDSTPLVKSTLKSGTGETGANFSLLARDGSTRRLEALARTECLDPSASDNAFELSPEWGLGSAGEPKADSAVKPITEATLKVAEAFRKHRLDAVMVGLRGYANVDGQGVFIGETFDGGTLLWVTKTSAVFGLEGLRVELRLNVESTVNRKGTVIENSSPHSPGKR